MLCCVTSPRGCRVCTPSYSERLSITWTWTTGAYDVFMRTLLCATKLFTVLLTHRSKRVKLNVFVSCRTNTNRGHPIKHILTRWLLIPCSWCFTVESFTSCYCVRAYPIIQRLITSINDINFCRNAMQARPMSSCGVSRSVCVSVTFVHSVKTNKHIFEMFSPAGSQAILVFRTKRHGNIPTGTP